MIYQLFLNNNIISTLHNNQFKVLIKLKLICLQFNSLTIIMKDTFRYNIILRKINLGHNLITIFNADLSHLPHLTILQIPYNKLKTLNEYSFKYFISGNESFIRYLSVHNNDLNCNCSMYWMLHLGDTMQANLTYDNICTNISDSNISDSKLNNIYLQCYMYHTTLSNATCEYINISNCRTGLYIIINHTLYNTINIFIYSSLIVVKLSLFYYIISIYLN